LLSSPEKGRILEIMDAQQRTPVELARKGVDPDIQKLVHPDV
jgi:hypothetical protein